MTFAHVSGGQVDLIGPLPASGHVTVDGERLGISGFDQLPADVLAAEGWLPLVDEPPEYDPTRETRTRTGHTIGSEQVSVDYDILPGPEPASIAEQRDASALAARMLVADQVRGQALTADQAAAVADLFPPWRVGEDVAVGDLRRYAGVPVECIQAHTTQADWPPDVTASLWRPYRDPNAIEPWVQPESTNPYQVGDRVTHNGKTWESTAADNVWEPGVYGWVEVTP